MVKSFIWALGFVVFLYLISIGLAVFYLPAGSSSAVQQTIFGFAWYWTFKGVEIIWYWGMVLVIVFIGGGLDIFIKVIFEPAWRALIDPSFFYSGTSFQTIFTLIRSTVQTLLQPLQQIGEELQIVSVQGLRDLLTGGS